MEDLIPKENTIIAMTSLGYIKRMTVDNLKHRTAVVVESKECRRLMRII